MKAKFAVAAAGLAAAAALTGCGDDPTEIAVAPAAGIAEQVGPIEIRNLFVLGGERGISIPVGGSAPVYFTLINEPAQVKTIAPGADSTGQAAGADTLEGVSSPAAKSGEIIGGPLQVPSGINVPVGPAAKVVLKDLTEELRPGNNVRVTLRFKNAGSGTFNVPIVSHGTSLQSFSPAPAG